MLSIPLNILVISVSSVFSGGFIMVSVLFLCFDYSIDYLVIVSVDVFCDAVSWPFNIFVMLSVLFLSSDDSVSGVFMF